MDNPLCTGGKVVSARRRRQGNRRGPVRQPEPLLDNYGNPVYWSYGKQRVMSEENTTKFRLNKKNLPRLSKSQTQRLDFMRDEEVEQAALSDPDNSPLTDEELAAFERVPDTKAIRKALRLTQREFSTTFQLSLATVRDWEQGRYQPDQAARTLLRIIARDPKAVKRALEIS